MTNLVDGSNVSFYLSVRFLISVVAFVGYCVLNMQRVILSIAIICMVNNTAISNKITHSSPASLNHTLLIADQQMSQQKNETAECVLETHKMSGARDGEFAWDKDIQGLVLSSFFYGYICTRKKNKYINTLPFRNSQH